MAIEKPGAPASPSTAAIQTPEPSSSTTRYPYSLQLSTFFSHSATRRAMKIYKDMGIEPYWISFRRSDQETVYQIFAGAFKDQDEAKKKREEYGTKQQELGKAVIAETPLANLIGTYKSDDEVEKEINRLEKLGFSPYTVKMDDGSQKLFIGAFTSERSAESLKRMLEAKDVQSQVVER
jgi:cell division septation protein DedD